MSRIHHLPGIAVLQQSYYSSGSTYSTWYDTPPTLRGLVSKAKKDGSNAAVAKTTGRFCKGRKLRGAVRVIRTCWFKLDVMCVQYARIAERGAVETYHTAVTLLYARVHTFLVSKSTYLSVPAVHAAPTCPWPKKGRKVTQTKVGTVAFELEHKSTESPEGGISMVNCCTSQRGPRKPVPGAVFHAPRWPRLALGPVLSPIRPCAARPVWGGRGPVVLPRVVAWHSGEPFKKGAYWNRHSCGDPKRDDDFHMRIIE